MGPLVAYWWPIQEGGSEVWDTFRVQHLQTEQNAIKAGMLSSRTQKAKSAADTGHVRRQPPHPGKCHTYAREFRLQSGHWTLN